MFIPILDLKREYASIKKEVDKELSDCLKTQHWVLGEKVSEFEKKSAEYLGVKYAVGVASGTDALTLSLTAVAIKLKNKECFDKKDEIITTPFTFIATAEAISRCGATPVFVDINPYTYNIEPAEIEKAVTKNTVGIMPVHLYGLGCDMTAISKIAKKHKLFIVEDTAQSFGGIHKNKKLGTFGDLGAYSFFPSKNLGGFGDGGLIVTNNEKLEKLLRILRNHGQVTQYDAAYLGFNSRLDSIQASVLGVKLKVIDKVNAERIKIAEQYNIAFADIKQIQTPDMPNMDKHIYHLYTIKVLSKRDELLKYLNAKGIGSRVYYPVPLNKMKAFKDSKIKGNLKNSEQSSKNVLSLPIHPFLKAEEINYVIKTVKTFFESKG